MQASAIDTAMRSNIVHVWQEMQKYDRLERTRGCHIITNFINASWHVPRLVLSSKIAETTQ
jgi:hypothetical protein